MFDENEIKYANTKEMTKLIVLLAKEAIPFELRGFILGNELSIQILSPSIDERKVDAICHWGSYGGDEGLIETMRETNEPGYDGVEGYLTAEQALEEFKKALRV